MCVLIANVEDGGQTNVISICLVWNIFFSHWLIIKNVSNVGSCFQMKLEKEQNNFMNGAWSRLVGIDTTKSITVNI